MGVRPYRRVLTGLPGPLQVAIVLATTGFVTFVAGLVFDFDLASVVLFFLYLGVLVCVGIELVRHDRTGARVAGILMLVAAALVVVALAGLFWFLSQLCEGGC